MKKTATVIPAPLCHVRNDEMPLLTAHRRVVETFGSALGKQRH
jgi:hypothetical protein